MWFAMPGFKPCPVIQGLGFRVHGFGIFAMSVNSGMSQSRFGWNEVDKGPPKDFRCTGHAKA